MSTEEATKQKVEIPKTIIFWMRTTSKLPIQVDSS